ncbi:MAG: glycosyltransferase family 2 protein [Alphaproteobacteria bacterium]|nr:glycosyltransferase family 2 protein [Alphaproteobacteria bacterium]
MSIQASIITLCYNQLETATKPFIESLYKYTNSDLFELIVINNASDDGTYEYLENIKQQYNNIKIIHNSENGGYAKGNNQGMKIAEGQYLFMLNNDTLFMPNWLERMIEILKTHQEIGILSTMTNHCIIPEQRIKNYQDLTPENYLQKVKLSSKNDITYNDVIIFFCWAMRREVFEKVGFLDENFGRAWYEDADYTLRVLYNGYKPAFANNIFIFHNHSQTSGKFAQTKEAEELFKKNRAYFENKHKFYLDLKNRVAELEEQLAGKKKTNWYKKIFSISPDKSGKHKTLRILGIKMKI